MNLIGEHTDYNDGFVLPLAVQFGCTAEVAQRTDGVVEVSSAQRPEPVRVPLDELRVGGSAAPDSWADYVLGVVHEVRRRGHHSGGLTIRVSSDVPVGAGLSSSAALVCSVAVALDGLLGLQLGSDGLVAVARAAENDFVGAPTGGMDQLVSVRGREGHAVLCDMRTLEVEQLPFDPQAHGLALLVVDTRAPHRLTDGPYARRRAQCAQAARQLGVPALRDVVDVEQALVELAWSDAADGVILRRARHVLTENERVLAAAELLRAGRLAELGPLLSASHASMRDDFEITVPEVDLAAETLLDAGALGARMTGGGFGGCVIALVPTEACEDAAAAVADAFAARGHTAPAHFLARASGGAEVV